jgi:hypothetical protein
MSNNENIEHTVSIGCNPTVDDGKRPANAADQMPGNEEGANIEARQMSKLTLNTSLEPALCHGMFSRA